MVHTTSRTVSSTLASRWSTGFEILASSNFRCLQMNVLSRVNKAANSPPMRPSSSAGTSVARCIWIGCTTCITEIGYRAKLYVSCVGYIRWLSGFIWVYVGFRRFLLKHLGLLLSGNTVTAQLQYQHPLLTPSMRWEKSPKDICSMFGVRKLESL